MRFATFFAVACLTATGFAQESGYQDIDFANTTGNGSATIPTRVFYPASAAGLNTPPIPQTGGYPVVVFLHGFGFTSTAYVTTGDYLAEQGYVVVMPDTGQNNQQVQLDDTIAMWTLLGDANVAVGGPLEGLLDLSKVALSGHSMGGNNVMVVMASNPGYMAGLAIAGTDQGAMINSAITEPMGFIHATGDTAIPWPNSVASFNGVVNFTGSKFVYVFGGNGTHLNVAVGGIGTTPGIFDRSIRVQSGFYDAYLKGDYAGLEEVVGPTATNEPELNQLLVEVETPVVWHVGTPMPGGQVRFEVLAEPGMAGVFIAPDLATTQTPFGTLYLDRNSLLIPKQGFIGNSNLLTWNGNVPVNTPVGFLLHVQGIGKRTTGATTFTELLTVTVQ